MIVEYKDHEGHRIIKNYDTVEDLCQGVRLAAAKLRIARRTKKDLTKERAEEMLREENRLMSMANRYAIVNHGTINKSSIIIGAETPEGRNK